MSPTLSPAGERPSARLRMPRRAWRVLIALFTLVGVCYGAAYMLALNIVTQLMRSAFNTQTARTVPPALLERIIPEGLFSGDVITAAGAVLLALSLALAGALVADARWMERVLPAWCGMAVSFAAIVLLGTQRPELAQMAAICAAWTAGVALVAWGARRTEPRAAAH